MKQRTHFSRHWILPIIIKTTHFIWLKIILQNLRCKFGCFIAFNTQFRFFNCSAFENSLWLNGFVIRSLTGLYCDWRNNLNLQNESEPEAWLCWRQFTYRHVHQTVARGSDVAFVWWDTLTNTHCCTALAEGGDFNETILNKSNNAGGDDDKTIHDYHPGGQRNIFEIKYCRWSFLVNIMRTFFASNETIVDVFFLWMTWSFIWSWCPYYPYT